MVLLTVKKKKKGEKRKRNEWKRLKKLEIPGGKKGENGTKTRLF